MTAAGTADKQGQAAQGEGGSRVPRGGCLLPWKRKGLEVHLHHLRLVGTWVGLSFLEKLR